MKKMLAIILFVAASAFAAPTARAEFGTISGTVNSAGRVAKYTFLAGKNLTKATLSTIAMPVVYPYKIVKKYPKSSGAVTAVVLASLATLWYTNPDIFIAHPFITDIMNGANQLTADAVQRAVDFLQYDCPEYAQWLRETACNNCPTPTPIPCAPVPCTPVDCLPVNCLAVDCTPVDCTPVDCIPVPCSATECLNHLMFWN